jgi:hypothetical protein
MKIRKIVPTIAVPVFALVAVLAMAHTAAYSNSRRSIQVRECPAEGRAAGETFMNQCMLLPGANELSCTADAQHEINNAIVDCQMAKVYLLGTALQATDDGAKGKATQAQERRDSMRFYDSLRHLGQ